MDKNVKGNVIGAIILGGVVLYLVSQKNKPSEPELPVSSSPKNFFQIFAGLIGEKVGWGIDYNEYSLSASLEQIQQLLVQNGFNLSKTAQFYDTLTDSEGDLLINRSIANMSDGTQIYLFALVDNKPFKSLVVSFV